jgi:hypothetical protein
MSIHESVKVHKLWYMCITVRTIIAIIPLIYNNLINKKKNINKISLITKILLLIIGLGFLKASIFGSNDEKQIAKVFWHETRIFHAFLYFLSGYHFYNYKFSSIILFTDLAFSIIYRLINGHFKNTY